MKKVVLLLGILALVCISFVRASGEEESLSMDGFPMTLHNDRCSRLFTMILNGDLMNDPEKGLKIPYNTIFPRPLADEWDHRSPLNNLKWINVTNIHINQLSARDCTIDYSKQSQTWIIVAAGVQSKVSGNWSYSWESGMPVLDDSGYFDVNTKDSGMTIIIQRFSKKEYIQGRVHRYDIVAPMDTAETGPDHVWRAFIFAGVPKSLVTTTSGTQYADFYNNLMKKYENEMKILWMGTMNVQLASMINHFCDDHLDKCDHLEDEFRALSGVGDIDTDDVEDDVEDDDDDHYNNVDQVDEEFCEEGDKFDGDNDEIDSEITEIDEFDEFDEVEAEVDPVDPTFHPSNEPDSEMDTDTVLEAMENVMNDLILESVAEEEKEPDVVIVINNHALTNLFGTVADFDDSEDDAGDGIDGGVAVGEEESVMNEAE